MRERVAETLQAEALRLIREREQGAVLFILLATLLPLVLLVGASSMTMQNRNGRMIDEITSERALMAAESGVDEAIYLGASGSLKSGVSFTRDLGNGMSCLLMPTYLMADGRDNDGDSQIDEPDENIFRLLSIGTFRDRTRTVVAYMGPTPGLPMLSSAIAVAGMPSEIKVESMATISGIDTTPVDIPVVFGKKGKKGFGPSDVPGIVASGGTLVALSKTVNLQTGGSIVGAGATTPSLGISATTPNVNSIVDAVRSSANQVLLKKEYKNVQLGNASIGDYRVMFRNGELELESGGRGAGVLVVTGQLEIKDGFRFDGLIVALGKVEIEKGAVINGGLILGPGQGDYDDHKDDPKIPELKIQVEKRARVQYSSEILRQVGALLPGKFVIMNGWQQIQGI